MTSDQAAAMAAELIAAVPPRTSGVKLCVRTTEGEKLPKPLDDLPSGIGVVTKYGVQWITDWRIVGEPFALFDTFEESKQLIEAINDQREKSWGKTRPKVTLDDDEDGDGSSRPRRFRVKRTDGLPQKTRRAKHRVSRRTPSPL